MFDFPVFPKDCKSCKYLKNKKHTLEYEQFLLELTVQ